MAAQDKLTPSEQLGDLLRQAGDNDAALKCYQTANVPSKVIEGLAAKGDFTELSRYTSAQVCDSPPCPLSSSACPIRALGPELPLARDWTLCVMDLTTASGRQADIACLVRPQHKAKLESC